jgi:hypothetical protein
VKFQQTNSMKLPVIKHLTQFIEENDPDYLIETIEVLEALTEVPSLKDEELDVIGELISNMYGALEVHKMVKEGFFPFFLFRKNHIYFPLGRRRKT